MAQPGDFSVVRSFNITILQVACTLLNTAGNRLRFELFTENVQQYTLDFLNGTTPTNVESLFNIPYYLFISQGYDSYIDCQLLNTATGNLTRPTGWQKTNMGIYYRKAAIDYQASGLVQNLTTFTINMGNLAITFQITLNILALEGDAVKEGEAELQQEVEQEIGEQIDTNQEDVAMEGDGRDLGWIGIDDLNWMPEGPSYTPVYPDWINDVIEPPTSQNPDALKGGAFQLIRERQVKREWAAFLEKKLLDELSTAEWERHTQRYKTEQFPDLGLMLRDTPGPFTEHQYHNEYDFAYEKRYRGFDSEGRHIYHRWDRVFQDVYDKINSVRQYWREPVDPWMHNYIPDQDTRDAAGRQLSNHIKSYFDPAGPGEPDNPLNMVKNVYNYMGSGVVGRAVSENRRAIGGATIPLLSKFALGAFGPYAVAAGTLAGMAAMSSGDIMSYFMPAAVAGNQLVNPLGLAKEMVLDKQNMYAQELLSSGFAEAAKVPLLQKIQSVMLGDVDREVTMSHGKSLMKSFQRNIDLAEGYTNEILMGGKNTAEQAALKFLVDKNVRLAHITEQSWNAVRETGAIIEGVDLLKQLPLYHSSSKAFGSLGPGGDGSGDGSFEFIANYINMDNNQKLLAAAVLPKLSEAELKNLPSIMNDIIKIPPKSFKANAIDTAYKAMNNPVLQFTMKWGGRALTAYAVANWLIGDVNNYNTVPASKERALGTSRMMSYDNTNRRALGETSFEPHNFNKMLSYDNINRIAPEAGLEPQVFNKANQLALLVVDPQNSKQRHISAQMHRQVNKKIAPVIAYAGPRSARKEQEAKIMTEQVLRVAKAAVQREHNNIPHNDKSRLLYPNSKKGLIGKRFMPRSYNYQSDNLQSFYDPEIRRDEEIYYTPRWLDQRKSFRPQTDIDYQSSKRQAKQTEKRSLFQYY